MDSLCLKAGIHGMKSPITVRSGGLDVRTNPSQVTASVGRSTTTSINGISVEKPKTSPWGFSFRRPLRSLWPGVGGGKRFDAIAADDAVLADEKGGVGDEEGENVERQNGNWVLKILHVRSLWREKEKEKEKEKGGIQIEIEIEQLGDQENEVVNDHQIRECSGDGNEDCDLCRTDDDDDGNKMEFDRVSFSKLLRRVSLAEARLYAQMSYLGSLAYSIPQIKPRNLLKYRGLRFVTSSLEKKELAAQAEKEKVSVEGQESEVTSKEADEGKEMKNRGNVISAYAAYQIAASAAAYLHSQTKSILPFKSSKSVPSENFLEGSGGFNDNGDIMNNDMASFMATTDSVTAVVAAKEEVKQAVADDLKSALSSPCEWFICDDGESGTRYFVIQGSESLASWQANLLFEPIQFEGLDVIVHRGIYEAAKGIYEQMLPEVHAHLKSRGDNATFRFTGHSLGGSLSLLVNLMLLIRGEVPPSSLLPIITFGAPSIMCGGDRLLRQLGLPRSHVQSIAMHRDIVPRAFSCNYPDHVAKLLKAVNRNFRSHPCLNNQKLLYAPMGEFLILQPDEKLSPNHDLLPSGSGLYLLRCPESDSTETEKQLRAAQSMFLNSPHPLEILSDRSAYGSDGTIHRDHDMNSYLKSVWCVIRQDLKRIRKTEREHRRKLWWPLVAPRGVSSGIIVGRPLGLGNNMGQEQLKFSGILQTGRESLKRFSRLVASQHMHLLVIFLFPARLLLLGTYSIINFH